MATFIFKVENSSNKAWSDVCEGLNTLYTGSDRGLSPIDYTAKQDHEQQINTYVKVFNKVGLHKSKNSSLAIALSEISDGQTIGVNYIDFKLIKDALSNGYEALYFGYIFDGEMATQAQVVERSFYFGRNTNGKMTNIASGEELEYNSKYAAAVWMVFYKIKNCDLYYVVCNNNLLDPTIIRQNFIQVPEWDNSEDIIALMNTHDGNFKQCVFRPDLEDASFVGDNIITTNKEKFVIDVLGLSKFHFINKAKLPDEKLPEIDLEINCSSNFTRLSNNKLEIDMSKNALATLSYKWITGTEMDYLASKEEALRYDFVIAKI